MILATQSLILQQLSMINLKNSKIEKNKQATKKMKTMATPSDRASPMQNAHLKKC